MMLPLYHGSSGVAISCTHLCITHVFILCAGSCNGKSLGLQEANDVCVCFLCSRLQWQSQEAIPCLGQVVMSSFSDCQNCSW